MTFSLLFFAWACGDDGSRSYDAGTQEIQIGTGSLGFEALSDEQELLLVFGRQGGYHFVVNAKIKGFLSGNPSMPGQLGNPQTLFTMYREDGTRIDSLLRPYRLGYREADAPWLELPSGRILQVNQKLIVDEALVPTIYSERVRLKVTITDARGDQASDEVWVLPQRDTTPDAGLYIDAGHDAGS